MIKSLIFSHILLMAFVASAVAQPHEVSGRVVSAATVEPLAGVRIGGDRLSTPVF